ncbi:MAG: hypothetical protein C0605_07910 [Hyphomicrobiales bacterium]|nr:MAG: hypothetical protein C0605_07910 [Hyphomicrobiales bacterium]
MLMLAGCGASSSLGRIKAGITLPPLDKDLRQPCPDPGVKAGQDARVVIAHTRRALGVCSRRHRDTVKFYDDTKRGFER